MARPLALAVFAAVLLAAGAAPAETPTSVTPFVDRPLVLTEGVGEIGGDLVVGLDKGSVGQLVGVWSPMPDSRTGGLFVKYGFARRIEAGLSVPYEHVNLRSDLPLSNALAVQGWPLRRDLSTNHHFGPISVWGRFALAPWASAEVALVAPVEKLRDNRLGVRASLPLKWIAVPGRLAIHLQPDLTIGFGRSDANLNSNIQISFFADAGLTVNVIPELFLDASVGYGRMLSPGPAGVLADWPVGHPAAKGVLPVGVTLGWTVIPTIDLVGGFALTNLTPGQGGATDARAMTVGVRYRF